MPPGIPGSNTTGGGQGGGQSAIMQNEKGQWVDRKTGFPVDISAAPQGGGQGGNNLIVDMPSQGGGQSTTGGMPIPKPDVSIAQPQGGNVAGVRAGAGGQMEQGINRPRTGGGRMPISKGQVIDGGWNRGQQQGGSGQQGGGGFQRQDNQGQQVLDSMKRHFDMMTPEQRMQNAGNFQRDMDRWQSNFGEGGNTREQVDLFNQIKDGIGSQRLRGFADPNNPMQFNDRQLREQSDARVQQRQLGQSQQPQASRMQQGPEARTEQPMFGQEGYGAMIRQRRQQQGNPNSLAALRQRASAQPTMNQKAPGMRTARAGSGGLNRLSNAARGSNMMKKPMLTYG
tara:strand:- start:3007 stop:4026 length:1020 start_codon:yes stop_codon:yes gene_type:complete